MTQKGQMVMDKFERKVTKIGNSLGLTLPQELYQKLNITQGDVLSLEFNENNDEIVIKKSKKVSMPEGINPKFLEAFSNSINQYDKTFKDLVTR